MLSKMETIVEPKVIKWARESIALGISKVAKRIDLSEDTIKKWESGESKPNLIQLEKLADIYKRPLAVLFLANPPPEPPLPDDFRSLPVGMEPFSSKTLLEIRRVRYVQSSYIELCESLNIHVFPKFNRVTTRYNPDKLALKTREELGVDVNLQFKWNNERKALINWKRIVEKQGVLVLEVSIPIEEGRAFSLIDKNLPVIVLNSKDSPTAKIFSLFHEYAHIILNHGGICDMSNKMERKSIERFCNRFAGSFLVPKDNLMESLKEYDIDYDFDNCLKILAKKFKVSRQVILRRLFIIDLIKNDLYQKKQKELMMEYKKIRKSKGGPSPSITCVRNNGFNFVSIVLGAYNGGRITYSDVSNYLNVKINHVPKIEQIIKELTS